MMLFWAYPVFLALGLCWYVVIKCGNACTTGRNILRVADVNSIQHKGFGIKLNNTSFSSFQSENKQGIFFTNAENDIYTISLIRRDQIVPPLKCRCSKFWNISHSGLSPCARLHHIQLSGCHKIPHFLHLHPQSFHGPQICAEKNKKFCVKLT